MHYNCGPNLRTAYTGTANATVREGSGHDTTTHIATRTRHQCAPPRHDQWGKLLVWGSGETGADAIQCTPAVCNYTPYGNPTARPTFSTNDKTKIVRIGGKIVRIGGKCVMVFVWCWAGGRVATQHHDRHELAMSLGPRNHTQHIVCTRVWCRAPATPDPRTLNPPPQRKHTEEIPNNRLDMPPKRQSSVGTLYETAKRARTCAQTLRN